MYFHVNPWNINWLEFLKPSLQSNTNSWKQTFQQYSQRKTVLINPVQELYNRRIKIEACYFWPFLYAHTICYVLYIPLSHINQYRSLKKFIHQIDWKWQVSCFSKFYSKFEFVLFLTQEKKFFLEVSFWTQQKKHSL